MESAYVQCPAPLAVSSPNDGMFEQAPLALPPLVEIMLCDPPTPMNAHTISHAFPLNTQTHLSTEIVRHIYRFIDEEDLYCAGSVSKEFRRWAVPALMERLGVSRSNASNQYHIRPVNGGKRAKTVLQFLVEFTLPNPISSLKVVTNMANHLDILQLTTKFIQSRPSLGKLVLIPEYAVESFRANGLETIIQSLLQAAGEKGCTDLAVQGGPFVPAYIMTRQPPDTVDSFNPMSTLQRLVIASPLFTILHYRDWLIDTLNSSLITHLQVTLIMARNVAGALLPQIDMPTLTDLDIGLPLAELAQILPFLQRHRTLRSLYIRSLRSALYIPPSSLKGLLPNLESLSGDFALLNVILAPVSSCASLRSIGIIDSIPWGSGDSESTPASWPVIPGSLCVHHPLATICRNRTDLDLRFFIDADHLAFDHLLDIACAKWELTMETVVEQTKELLAGVAELNLTQLKGKVKAPEWLKLFVGVRKVNLSGLVPVGTREKKRLDEEVQRMCPGDRKSVV